MIFKSRKKSPNRSIKVTDSELCLMFQNKRNSKILIDNPNYMFGVRKRKKLLKDFCKYRNYSKKAKKGTKICTTTKEKNTLHYNTRAKNISNPIQNDIEAQKYE
jgi:hypothetical protein